MRIQGLVLASVLAASCASRNVSDSELTCSPQVLDPGEVFHEDWDGCIEGWRARDGEPVTTVAETVEPGRKLVQNLTRATEDSSGTMCSSWLSLVPVTGGATYCLGAWIRWAGGNAPFVGIRRYDLNQVDLGVDERLLAYPAGDAGMPAGVRPIALEPGAYRYYQASFTVPAETGYLQVLDGLDAAVSLEGTEDGAYVDVLSIRNGACAEDQIPISISGGLTTWATSPLGANLTYSATAADPATGAPLAVTCSPASGALFPMGTTTITCSASTGGIQGSKSVDAHVLTWGRGVRSALLVAPTSGAADLELQVATRLRGLGLDVTTVAASALTGAKAAGRTVVVVMPGVDGATVQSSLRTVRSPVMVLEPTALDDLGLTSTTANTDFGAIASANQVVIAQPTHPLAAGLAGLGTVYSSPGSLGWGKPAAGAANVATVVGQSDRATIFGYQTGAEMVGLTAPARRAGLFLTRTVGYGISNVGWMFFDAAVKWLATPEVLFVVADSAALNASDTALKNRLGWLGFDPVVICDETVTASDADGRMAVLVSGSVSASVLGSKLNNIRVPMAVLLPGLFGTLGMTGTVSGTDYGTLASQTSLAVLQTTHPLAAGLAETVQVTNSNDTATFAWGKAGANAQQVAQIAGTTKVAVFGYEASAVMPGMVAPGRRVGAFIAADAEKLGSDGWKMFDAAIRWASRPVALVIAGVSPPATDDQRVATELLRIGYGASLPAAAIAVDADLAERSLVVVTGQATAANLPASLVSSPIPALVALPGCFDSLSLTATTSGTDYGTAASQTMVSVAAPSHPLAAGLTGDVSVASSAGTVGWGKPASSATKVATVMGNANQSTIFAYDPTTLLVNGQLAPGRRVGWFGQRAMVPNLTASGWDLFDAAALWAGGWTQALRGTHEIPPCTGLFCDNFEDGDANGWTIRQGAVSDFSVVSDGTWVYRQANPATSGWRISQAGAGWGDQVVEARIKVTSFAGSNGAYVAGVFGRYNTTSDCAYMVAVGGDGKMSIRKRVGGTTTVLGAPISAGISAGSWYLLRLEMEGTRLGAYLNDVPMITLTDSSCSSGSVGVGSQGAAFEADDVRVYEPAPNGTPWFAGFEDPARPWTTTGVGTILVTTTDKTEGARSLAVSGCGYTEIFSPLFNTNEFPLVGAKMAFDIKLPTAQENPYWTGQAQIFATIPGLALFNVPFGNVELTTLSPLGTWKSAEFTVPTNIYQAFFGSYANSQLRITINTNNCPASIYIDNLHFTGTLTHR